MEGPIIDGMATHHVDDHAGSRFWRCNACRADWVRPAEAPLHEGERCLNCDGLLVTVQAPGS
jgi:formate dehydrogenase maturation protein FdhE